MCVCLFVSLSRCLSGRFNCEGLVPHKQYFAGTMLGMSSCASYVSRTHDVIDDVTKSQSKSNFEIDISPSIFELERRSKAQNVRNAHCYCSGIFSFRYNFRWKSLSRPQISDHFENFEILNTASISPRILKDRPKLCQKSIFMMMTSSMTSQGGLKVGPLYYFTNEVPTFFMITKQRAKISSLNFLCICIMRLWLLLYEYIFMTPLMTSRGHKIGQILKLIYIRQYLSYSVDQILKMSEMLMAIFLVYSTSGITSGKIVWRAQNGGHFENFIKLNTASIWPLIWKGRPKLCKKKFFMVMTSSMTSKGGLKVSLYIHV